MINQSRKRSAMRRALSCKRCRAIRLRLGNAIVAHRQGVLVEPSANSDWLALNSVKSPCVAKFRVCPKLAGNRRTSNEYERSYRRYADPHSQCARRAENDRRDAFLQGEGCDCQRS